MDFISSNTSKVLEIGSDNSKLAKILEERFKDEYWSLNVGTELIDELCKLNDKFYDCVIFNDSFCQVYDPEAVLDLLKQKMNINGYIIATVYNIRYIELLNQLFNKKQWKYSNQGILNRKNIRFFTKKSLEHEFHSQGYYFITFKGLNPFNKLIYKILNRMLFNNLNDCKHEKFLIVAKY